MKLQAGNLKFYFKKESDTRVFYEFCTILFHKRPADGWFACISYLNKQHGFGGKARLAEVKRKCF